VKGHGDVREAGSNSQFEPGEKKTEVDIYIRILNWLRITDQTTPIKFDALLKTESETTYVQRSSM